MIGSSICLLTDSERAVRTLRNAMFEIAHEGANDLGQSIILAASLHADCLDYGLIDDARHSTHDCRGDSMKTLEPKGTLAIQDEFIATVNFGFARWSHTRKSKYQTCGGHFGRIYSGAHRKAEKSLRVLGITDKAQIAQIIKDARDMAELERNAE